MALNSIRHLDEEDLKADRRYAVILTLLLFLFPILTIVAGAVSGHVLWGIGGASAIFAVGAEIALSTRNRIFSDFFVVRDVSKLVEVVPVEDGQQIDEFANEMTLAFLRKPDEEWLVFVYNWLLSCSAIRIDGKLRVFTLSGEDFVRHTGFDLVADNDFLLIPESELDLTFADRNRIITELTIIGGTLFGSAIDAIARTRIEGDGNDEAKASLPEAPSSKASLPEPSPLEPSLPEVPLSEAAPSQAGTLSNKGQRID